nr:transposase [Escherichia coli]
MLAFGGTVADFTAAVEADCPLQRMMSFAFVKRDAVRIALTSGLTRRQVASDLSIGLSTLGKWIASISDETKIPTQDTDLLRENERLRKENGFVE